MDNSTSALYCEHANEVPMICKCDDSCYCKQHSCKERTGTGTLSNKTSHRYEPGTMTKSVCGVCGAAMVVRRNVLDATGWAQAMSGKKTLHDHFWCPHFEEKWHEKAERILKESEETASEKIRSILLSEVNEILTKNGCNTA